MDRAYSLHPSAVNGVPRSSVPAFQSSKESDVPEWEGQEWEGQEWEGPQAAKNKNKKTSGQEIAPTFHLPGWLDKIGLFAPQRKTHTWELQRDSHTCPWWAAFLPGRLPSGSPKAQPNLPRKYCSAMFVRSLLKVNGREKATFPGRETGWCSRASAMPGTLSTRFS